MVKEAALAQLKDIQLPKAVGLWPLAPGWYVLITLLTLLMSYMLYWAYQRHVDARPKKQALNLLAHYAAQYQRDKNTQLASARISELLKRVALVYFPRTEVANLHGQQWVDFLTQTSKGVDFNSIKARLLDSPFKPNEAVDLTPLFQQAKLWIQQRRGHVRTH